MALPVEAEEYLRSNNLDPTQYDINRNGDLVKVGGLGGRAWIGLKDAAKAAGRTLLSMPGDLIQALPVMGEAVAKQSRAMEERLLDPATLPASRPMTLEELEAHPLTRAGKSLSSIADIVPETSGTSPIAEAVGGTAGALLPAVGEALARRSFPSFSASRIAPLLRGGTYALPAGQQAQAVAERNIEHQKETAPDQPVNVGQAGERAAAAAFVDAVLGKFIGQGQLVKLIEGPAAGLLKRAATQAGAGAIEGGTSAAAQDLLATGDTSLKSIGLGAAGGAVGQGGMAAAVGGRGPKAAEDAAAKSVVDDAAGFGVDETQAPAVAADKPAYTEAELAIILDPLRKYDPPKKYRTPNDDVIVDAKEAGLLETPEDVQRLVTAEDKKVAFRELYAEKSAKAPENRENAQVDSIAEQAKQAAAMSEKFQNDLAELNKLKKTIQTEIQTIEEDTTREAGKKWEMRNAAKQELQLVDQSIDQLIDAHLKSRIGEAKPEELGPVLGPEPEKALAPAIVEAQKRMPPEKFKKFMQNLDARQQENARIGQQITAQQLKEALEDAIMPAVKAQEAEMWSLQRAMEAQRQESKERYQRGELLSGLPRKWMEGEQRVPFRAGSLDAPPMPERPESLAEQAKLVADPRSPKKAMLVAGDGTLPSKLPAGLATQATPHGDVVYNPAKVGKEEVVAAGRGDVFDGKLLGYTESLPAGDAIVTTKVNGVPDVVTEVTTQDKVAKVKANQQALTNNKGETTTATPEEILEQRRQAGGYTVGPVYHGTEAATIEKFRKKNSGIWVANKEVDAQPAITDRNTLLTLYVNPGERPYKLTDAEYAAWKASSNPKKWIEQKRWETQATSIQVGDYATVLFDPKQLKSADAVTYDKQGKVIPPEERYNPDDPRILYSSMFGLTPSALEKLSKQFKRSPAGSFLKAIHAVTAGSTDKMAARSPLQAAASERYLMMDRDRRRVAEDKMRMLDPYKKMLEDPRYIDWVHERTDKQNTDYSKLPKEYQALAAKFHSEFVPHFHREQNEKNVLVKTSDGQFRKAVDQPNYYFHGLNKEIYDKLQSGTPEERAALEEKWVKHYQSFVKRATRDEAMEALAEFRGDFARVQVRGGQPLFAPVIREYGVPLPRDWRANPYESAVNYIRRWSMHMKWAEYVQNDPLMRRAFGITEDSAGRDTKAIDAKHRMTNADWQDAFRAGKRIDAEWTWNATPDKYKTQSAEGVPLQSGDPVAEDLRVSYTGQSLRPGSKLFDSLQRLASPIVMGHASKIRDISQSVTTGGEYAPAVVDYAADVAKTFADMRGSADRARKAGYLDRDPIAHELPLNATSPNSAINWWADAVNRAADGFRTYFGIKHLDIASKVLAYEPARAAVERQIAALGMDKSPLVAEFGPPPSLLKNMSPADVTEITAATIADAVSPRYSAENVPHKLLPQNQHFIGAMIRLMTWSVARYNKWYKYNWIPTAKPQRAERLIKSLFYGVVGGAATASLLEFLRDKKPAKLTMTEWFGLDDDAKWREIAPLVGGYIDAQGSLGVLGWAANKAVMYKAGRPAASADLDPMLPVLIAGTQTFGTLFNFAEHANEKGWGKIDVHDLGKLSLELANVSQSARDIVSRLGLDDRKETRDVNRESKVFEQVTGRSAKTGEPVKPAGFFYGSYRRNPFSLSAEMNEAKTADDVRRLVPQLKDTAARGLPLPAIRGDEKIPAFYQDVARRRGLDYARKLAERDQRELTLDEAKRAFLGRDSGR